MQNFYFFCKDTKNDDKPVAFILKSFAGRFALLPIPIYFNGKKFVEK